MLQGISELQLSLIVIAVISVGGVWAYNQWQERKQRKQAHAVFRNQQPDVLMRETKNPVTASSPIESSVPSSEETGRNDDSSRDHDRMDRMEPVFIAPEARASQDHDQHVIAAVSDTPAAPAIPEHPPEEKDIAQDGQQTAPDSLDEMADLRIEPYLESEAVLMTSSEEPAAPDTNEAENVTEAQVADDGELPILDTVVDREPPQTLADPVIDAIVHLNAPELISAPLFWSAQRQILSRLANRIVWSGLDENSAQWQPLQANDANSYRRLVGALLLVDRHGPIAADDLALYCDGVRQLATHYQAQAIVPVVADVLTRARSLDEFCATVDWRISIHLIHHEGHGISLDAIAQLTEMTGLRRHDLRHQMDQGTLYAFDVKNRPAFTLGLLGGASTTEHGAQVAGVTLTLDVPKVADGVAVFDRMLQLACHLANHLDAVIVDDKRSPLPDAMLAKIRAKIDEFDQRMNLHQIPAGGRRALRLYA